ncbi:hypothetical protein HKD37_02G006120 [Glycine soja]
MKSALKLKVEKKDVEMGIWAMQAQIWRFVCLVSTVIGLVCYAISSSFNLSIWKVEPAKNTVLQSQSA